MKIGKDEKIKYKRKENEWWLKFLKIMSFAQHEEVYFLGAGTYRLHRMSEIILLLSGLLLTTIHMLETIFIGML